ncbi:Predicted Zn-dependent peptidase [Geodermatophilus saharensis]|uniref:Predicted Zn-dependent peptidase n=1 Tax=Geodermatophilus saharensis TaxID=1137994 RepID=A0A238ZX54_9ACTN|nr:Predicted Zn-dependent peptidase [Geodermatophilus saharensis]
MSAPDGGAAAPDHGPVQRAVIDGVPVFTAGGRERTTAALVFGVGLRDETFATIEVTHLVEHLAMAALPRTHLRCNAVTDVDSTAFFATGRPQAVGAFLEGVCRALADLPTDRLAAEAGVLQAEGCGSTSSTVSALWAARYGLTGPGLTVSAGPGPHHLTEDAVRAHAARWFVRGNAALWCHGPLPAGLRLPLPAGPRPPRRLPVPRPQDGPVWTRTDAPGVGLLLATDTPADAALAVGVQVVGERLRDRARHGRGLSYRVDSLTLDLAADRREVALVVDARAGHDAEVADLVWRTFAELCADGPTPEEVGHAVAGLEAELDEEDAAGAELADAAYCAATGLPFRPAAATLAAWRAVTPADATAALRRAEPTAVLAVPDTASWDGPAGVARRPLCGTLPELPEGTLFRPPLHRRLLDPAARVALVVSREGLAHRDADGDVHGVPWSRVEALVPTDEGRGLTVVSRDLCCVHVHPDRYGPRAVAAVLERAPAGTLLGRPASEAPEYAAV